MRKTFTLVITLLTLLASLNAKNKKNPWQDYKRIDLKIDGRNAFIIQPKESAPNKPWVWRARFPTYHPEVDLILLSKGFHVAYINTDDMLGSPTALKH